MGLLLITHDLGVVAETTDRVNVMYAGRIVESGATASVFARLAHPYSRGLFAAMPQLDAAMPGRTRLNTIPGVVPDPTARPPGCVFADRCFQARPRCQEGFPPDLALDPAHRVACYFPVTEPLTS
jgi:peptide/nickel transport system ATP-binding protein